MSVVTRSVSLIGWSLLVAAPCVAQSIGTFTATGDMTTSRSFHTATLLRNGKVLIVGTTSADIYDPATGTFTATGAMTTARSQHMATLLDDGRVLVVGVEPFSGVTPSTSSADVYDPSTGTFTRAGDMVTAQIGGTATLLSDGKVLIAGGLTSWCCQPATIANPELYDPSTGTFTLTGTFASPGDGFYVTGGPNVSAPAIRLPDGRVLFAGEPDSELYDPVTGTFRVTGRMMTLCGGYPTYISGRTATLLTNGKVLLTGGGDEVCGRYANADLYDPATETFSATGNMTRVRVFHSATLLPNGTAMITGGESVECNNTGCFLSSETSAEIYDPVLGTFAAVGAMTAGRVSHTSTMLNNGTVLITGGHCYTGIGVYCGNLASAELYTPADSTANWAYCAQEGGSCTFTGTKQVRYGANGSYYYKTLTDGTACTNTVFGDPVFGIVKQCDIWSDWTFCAWENGFCTFSGTQQVRYGANGAYVYKTLTGGTACTNSVFGDPIVGTVKQCAIRSTPPPTEWTLCAPEGGVCAFTGTTEVRYGANGSYVFKTLTDGTACTNEVFGDPIYGVVKSCELRTP